MEIVEGEAAVLGVNVGHPVVANRDFVAYLCKTACIDVILWCGIGCSVLAAE